MWCKLDLFLGYSLIFLPIAYQPILSHFFTFLPHGLWEKAPGRHRGSPGWTADAETLRRQWQELPWCRSGSGSLLTMEQTHTMNTVVLWNCTFFFVNWYCILTMETWLHTYYISYYYYIYQRTNIIKSHFHQVVSLADGGWLWRSRASHSCVRDLPDFTAWRW